VADSMDRLPLDNFLYKDRAAPIPGDRCGDSGFAIKKVSGDLLSFDHDIPTLAAEQLVKAVSTSVRQLRRTRV
jgi:hypothetical protein